MRMVRARPARKVVDWQKALELHWAALHCDDVKMTTDGDHHTFEVHVCTGELDAKAIAVELYADGANGGAPERQEMKAIGGCVYTARVPAARPGSDYTVRVIPHLDGAAVPLEANHILWQRP
jgi:starch phosphorylase